MQKIMFSEKYGLESAVLSKLKTMTRRVITDVDGIQILQELEEDGWENTADIQIFIDKYARYKVGEVVAIAQSYQRAGVAPDFGIKQVVRYNGGNGVMETEARYTIGWTNKLFVKPELMPHQIRTTNIKIERLQDISDEDCLKEGIEIDTHRQVLSDDIYTFYVNGQHCCQWHFYTPREAFAALINKVSPKMGEKTMWEANPFVFAYSFELIK